MECAPMFFFEKLIKDQLETEVEVTYEKARDSYIPRDSKVQESHLDYKGKS